MKAFVPRSAAAPATAAPSGKAVAPADNRPAAVAQRQLQATIAASPRQEPPLQLAAPRRNTTGLPDQLKAGVESLSGHSLDDVKVHYNSAKPAQLQALAYAQGTNIHIGPGQEEHLPHEAWHVVQQKQGRVRTTQQFRGVALNDDSALEKEADAVGMVAARQPKQQDDVGMLQKKAAPMSAFPMQRTTNAELPEASLAALESKVAELLTKLGQNHSVDSGSSGAASHMVGPPVQRVRGGTTKHNANYLKRVNKLTNSLKAALGNPKHAKAAAVRLKTARGLAIRLDAGDLSKLRYRPHRRKDGTLHPHWQALSEARGMYTLLRNLQVDKEDVRYFQQVDPITSRIIARDMRARLTPGAVNLPVGSTPSTNELYYGEPTLVRRKNSSGSALYIKGHLLNDHIGGAGLPHNLVPLTAEKAKSNKTGSNDANGEHNKKVEEPIKTLLSQPSIFYPNTQLSYRVESLPPLGVGARSATANVQQYATVFQAAAINPTNVNKKTKDLNDEIIIAHPASEDVVKGITAAVGGNGYSPANMVSRLTENAALWHTEDTTIPAGLQCSASYTDINGTLQKIVDKLVIHNVLPTKYTAPFK